MARMTLRDPPKLLRLNSAMDRASLSPLKGPGRLMMIPIDSYITLHERTKQKMKGSKYPHSLTFSGNENSSDHSSRGLDCIW
jgi:hypothetical protein